MTNFINLLGRAVAAMGLIISPVLTKLLTAFYRQAEQGAMIPTALLRGVPGSGKTSTAEAFALAVGAHKFFYQCNPGTGKDELIGQPNLAAVLRQDSEHAISDGILIQAVKAAMTGQDVVLILDEIDKSSPEVDSYLLDFLQSRRIHDSTMTELVIPTDVKFWVFLTSNGERDLSDALMRRVKRFNVERPSRSTVAEVLGINEGAALLDIWQSCESLAISQMQQYLQDGGDPEDIDIDLLSQYIDDLPDVIEPVVQEVSNIEPARIIMRLKDLVGDRWTTLPWTPSGQENVEIKISTFSDLVKLQSCCNDSCDVKIRHYDGVDGFVEVDTLYPTIVGDHGAIFKVGDRSFVTEHIRGKYYLRIDDELYYTDIRRGWMWPEILAASKTRWFRAEHARNMLEARKKASVDQAAHLLEGLGLDDLL